MEIITEKSGTRLDKFLTNKLNLTRSKVQKLIKGGFILINGEIENSNYIVKLNDNIEILDYDFNVKLEKEDIPLDIVYEDEYLMVINKQSGMVTHPAVGNYNHTLVNALMYYLNIDEVSTIRPGIVHRLDKDTSGLMIVAKTEESLEKLSLMIRERKVERIYNALVWRVIKHEKGTIDAPIGRDVKTREKYIVTNINSKDAITHFRVLERYKESTFIECKLETGRTHQIRVHMNYINHPIVNDPVYSNRKLFDNSGQMLHSKSIRFIHPFTNKELYFDSLLPNKILSILNRFKDS